jgi:hypothetical protein
MLQAGGATSKAGGGEMELARGSTCSKCCKVAPDRQG